MVGNEESFLCLCYVGPFWVDNKYFGGGDFPQAELCLSLSFENIFCF